MASFLLSSMPIQAQDNTSESELSFDIELPSLPDDFATPPEQVEALITLFLEGRSGLIYDNNIFRSPNDEQSDLIAIFAPKLRLQSATENYRWETSAELELGEYKNTSGNDYVDFSLDFSADWQLSDVLALAGFARFRDDHQAIGFADEPERAAAEATDFQHADAVINLSYTPGTLFIEFDTLLDFYDYENTPRLDGSLIFNDDRDRTEFEQLIKVGYELAQIRPYLFAMFNNRSYQDNVDGIELFDRDSNGFSAGAGVAYGEKNAVLAADFQIGYLEQDYDAEELQDVSDIGFLARLDWRPSAQFRLTSITARTVKETTLSGASSYLSTDVSLTATYAIRPDISLYFKARHEQRDFQIDSLLAQRDQRDDDVNRATLGTNWKLPHNLYLDAHYAYTQRDSSDPDVDYDSHSANLGLSVRF